LRRTTKSKDQQVRLTQFVVMQIVHSFPVLFGYEYFVSVRT
jgi:hypothetical protein